MKSEQIELMQHALGINENQREPYRNYFLASGGNAANPDWQELVTAGYATSSPAPAWSCGDVTYQVTDAGKTLAIAALTEPKKRTRYEQYLDADTIQSFAEWLGIDVPEVEYGSWYPNRGMYRMVSRRASGEWCATQKAAKASYKLALKVRQHTQGERE
ncbi:hypothetical protein [Serratia fonticola]